ncbi:uncharacterized protein Nuak [Anabrus simplex]|uniref:uncharacterized protein Nuak n=1 Tax=Anabrus simplex TaxID=316456 RepID=UPI0035A27431
MVVGDVGIHNIMGGMENTAGVRLHNHRRKLKQRFDIIRKLGQGTYGKVQLGINKETGQEVAIKTIKKAKIETEADLVRIRREIQIMSSVQHPNIIHIYEVFENREKMVLVMEYAAGGELYDYLSERKVLSEQEARRIFRQIATAVYYCHKHKICHRDLKLENILLDEHGSAKIADFGLSNVFDEQRLLNTFCGSPLYASPEIVKGTPYHGPEVDCWSLGVLLYTLVYGAMPFDGSNFKRLVKQISQGDYFEPKKPSPASPLIRDMLTVAPVRRADIEKICSHWWVNEDYTESCLEIAEELANQTPVRLDLLLSLAPPAPSVGSDKLLITKEQGAGDVASMGTTMIPARCHSVGSLMELDHPSTERRMAGFDKERLLQNEISSTEAPKRKLEEGISTEEANQAGSKRKERSRRRERDRSSDRRHHRSSSRNKHTVESNNKSLLESKDENLKSEQGEDMMDVDTDGSSFALQYIDTSLRESEETITGSIKAAASSVETMAGSSSAVPEQEHVDVTLKSPTKEKGIWKPVKKKCKAGTESEVADKPSVETSDEKEAMFNLQNLIEGDVKEDVTAKARKKKQVATEAKVNESSEVLGEKETLLDASSKENDTVIDHSAQDLKDNKGSKESEPKGNTELNVVSSSTEGNVDVKERVASKPIEMPKKGVKTRKSKGELSLGKLGSSSEKSSGANTPDETASPPARPMERRRSKIFETAEKFNNLLSGSSEPKSPTTEKPKKVFIPGVKVSDAKRAFERKSSLPEAIVPTLSKTSVPKKVPEVNSDATVKGTCQDNTEVSVAQKVEKKPMESSLMEIKEKDQNGAKSNSVKNQQSLTSEKGNEKVHPDAGEAELKPEEEDTNLQLIPALPVTDKIAQQEEARIKKLKDAVEIISNAIAEESKKENLPDSNKKVSSSKPPVPASPDSKGRTKGTGVSGPTSPKSPPPSPLDPATGKKTVRVQVAPNDVRLATIQVSTPEATKFPFNESNITKGESVQGAGEVNGPAEDAKSEIVRSKDSKSVEDGSGKKKSAKVEITLKSATLPRRKTSKAEIQLGSPAVPPVEFKTEVEHMVGTSLPSTKPTQRSEVAFPIAGVSSKTSAFRSMSSEPDEIPRTKPRERIIPIKLEDSTTEAAPVTTPPPARPPVPPFQPQRSLSQSQRSGSLSRQSTQDSDTEGPDTIHKSPREFIIPIAVEGGGYVTPRAGSLEPSASDESTSRSRHRSSSRFGRPRRMSSLLSDASEDEGFNSPFATLQRHSSLGRDDDDDKSFHMHRLRSSRPSRHPLEHADSLSSAEEDDDDDGFEILTAESLFSTLLSRVRSLTQRLNVEDASRPGFPSSRLMNQLKSIGHTSPSSFWNNVYAHQQEPLSRRLSESSQFSRSFSRDSELGSTPWRRSVSRDVSDCDSVYSETSSTTGTLPRASVRVTVHVPGGRGRGGSGGEPRHSTTGIY